MAMKKAGLETHKEQYRQVAQQRRLEQAMKQGELF